MEAKAEADAEKAGIAQAQSPQLLYDMIDEVDLQLVIGCRVQCRPACQKGPLVNYAITNCRSTGLFGQLIYLSGQYLAAACVIYGTQIS